MRSFPTIAWTGSTERREAYDERRFVFLTPAESVCVLFRSLRFPLKNNVGQPLVSRLLAYPARASYTSHMPNTCPFAYPFRTPCISLYAAIYPYVPRASTFAPFLSQCAVEFLFAESECDWEITANRRLPSDRRLPAGLGRVHIPELQPGCGHCLVSSCCDFPAVYVHLIMYIIIQ